MNDPLRISLSLVSHTNIGKTTLARTLLLRDVGEVADRAHVTETTDAYVLARSNAGGELILWDTPGFGNSVALAKRLEGRSNPVGWFLSSVWDRLANRSFWLDQVAMRHIRDTSSVVLYLVNASETFERSPYLEAEMRILSWLGKPAIVLLNQMGPPREPALEAAEVDAWKRSLAPYAFVTDVLPMDAFARCWVQEAALFDAIGRALPPEQHEAFAALRNIWMRGRRAIYASSVEAIALYLRRLILASEPIPTLGLKARALSVAKRFGLFQDEKDAKEALADAQSALGSQAADGFCSLTNKLIEVNGLSGRGVSKEILRRLRVNWKISAFGVDPGSAAAVGTGLGAASGAAAGLAADAAAGGLTLGLGTLIGGILGAVGGIGAAAAYNLKAGRRGSELSWSDEALESALLESILLYLAVAHFGRGRGEWTESESPAFWKGTAARAMKAHPVAFKTLRGEGNGESGRDADALQSALCANVDAVIRGIFQALYGREG